MTTMTTTMTTTTTARFIRQNKSAGDDAADAYGVLLDTRCSFDWFRSNGMPDAGVV